MQNSTSPITIRRYFITGSQRLSNFFLASLIFFGGAGFLLTGFFSFLNRVTPSMPSPSVTQSKDFAQQTIPYVGSEKAGSKQMVFSTDKSPSLLLDATHLPFLLGDPEDHTNFCRAFVSQKVLVPYGEKEQNLALSGSETIEFGVSFAPATPTGQGSENELQSKLTNNSIRFFPQGLIMCFYGSLGLIFSLYLWLTILWKVGNGFNEFNKETGIIRIFRWGLPGKNRQIDFSYRLKDIEALRVSLKEGINPRRSIALQIKGKGEIPLTRIGEPMALQDIENQASELANFLKVEIQVIQL